MKTPAPSHHSSLCALSDAVQDEGVEAAAEDDIYDVIIRDIAKHVSEYRIPIDDECARYNEMKKGQTIVK